MTLSRRSHFCATSASSWEEIWEAGPYYRRISELLEQASDYAIFTGWQIDSRLLLEKPGPSGQEPGFETLKQKILRLCDEKPEFHFYFLMWDHAYFYMIERELMQGRVWDEIHPRVHFIFDNRHPFGGAHHEKLAIIDGKIAFCGGIDLCDERWDSPNHLFLDPRRSLLRRKEHHRPYHDIAVQVTGPVCAQIQHHIAKRWHAITNIPFPEPRWDLSRRMHGGHRVYLSRTIADVDAGEKGLPLVREAEFLFRELIDRAQRRLVFEGQYFWSEELCECLARKMRQMRGRPFEIVLVLAEIRKINSFTRQMSGHEFKLLERLQTEAHRSGTTLLMGAPYVYPQSGSVDELRGFVEDESETTELLAPRPVYIHSKAVIVDDEYLSVGSTNLAARALRIDTELNLTLEATTDFERARIRRFARRLAEHWNLGDEPARHIVLRRFHPSAEIRELHAERPVLSRMPWQLIFDPKLPWLYLLKRRLRVLERRRSNWVWILASLAWLLGFVAQLAIFVALEGTAPLLHQGGQGGAAFFYLLLFSLVDLVPLPFAAIATICSLQLGLNAGIALTLGALWTGSIQGYLIGRTLPLKVRKFCYRTLAASKPRGLLEKLGHRSFPDLVRGLLDPRVGIREKILYQGIYCVPAPWFALGTLILLPSVYFMALHAGIPELLRIFPQLSILAANGPIAAGVLAAVYSVGMLRRLARTANAAAPRPLFEDGKAKTQDSFLQYPQGF